MIRHLLRPFSYLTIDHKSKWKVDWLFPILFACVSSGLIFSLKKFGEIHLYSEGALIAKILGFVQSLPGFYIAALAAIATFNKIDIDKTMPSPAPKIDIKVHGKSVIIELTRRRFLCSMFAFLTAESILIIILSVSAETFYLPLKKIIPENLHVMSSVSFIFGFFLLFWQMIIATFWGLFYLGERLHQPDA